MRMFNLTLHNCTSDLEERLKAMTVTDFKAAYQMRDAIDLLGIIRDVAHNHLDDKNEMMACVEADLTIYTYMQAGKQGEQQLRQAIPCNRLWSLRTTGARGSTQR